MLAGMTSEHLSEWQAFLKVEAEQRKAEEAQPAAVARARGEYQPPNKRRRS